MKWASLVVAFLCLVQDVRASLLDTTFDIGTGADGLVEQVLELPDGKVLVCGNFTTFNGANRSYIARLNHDGSVDLTFEAHPGYWVRHMAVQSDGKIVIGGYFTTVNDISRNLVARLNSNGSLDPSFDPGTGAEDIIAGGIDGNMTPFVFWIEIQEDGKILITGNFREYNNEPSMGFARLNSDGTLDKTFQIGPGLDSWGRVIKLRSNGQIYVGGWFTSYNGFNANRIVRMNTNGTPDKTFSAFYGDATAVYSIAELPDGKLITSGHSKNGEDLFKENVVRLNSDGSVDQTWNGATNEKTESVLLLPNNDLLLGGYFSELNGQHRDGIGRLLPDGTLDNGFSANVDNFVWTIAPAQNDKVLISGGFTKIDGIARSGVARLIVPASTNSVSTPEPRMTGARMADGKFHVTVSTGPGVTYALEAAEDPAGPWTEIASTVATESTLDFEDANIEERRFYRIVVR